MPKTIFEELAIAQQKEELARIKILARIKAGDIKGAHSIAKPYLEKLSQGGSNQKIPTGWVNIAKTLCAVDIQKHGVNKTEMGSFPKEQAWLDTALEIIFNRAKGFLKALVPTTMAIALMTQVLGPTPINADQASILATSLTQATNNNQEKDEPLNWQLLNQGVESLPKSLNDRLKGEIYTFNPKKDQAIGLSLGSVKRNQETKLIEAELIAKNISDSKISISQFTMTDARYEGSEIKNESNESNESNDPNESKDLKTLKNNSSPSEIPPGSSAIYKVTIAKTKSPQIMMRASNGEAHSMNLNLDGFDKLSNPIERKSWAQYTLSNKGKEDLEITLNTPEGVRVTKLKLSEGDRELNIQAPQNSLILKPTQVATLSVEAKKNYSPDLELVSKSKDKASKSTTHKLKTNPLVNLGWSINKTYDSIVSLIVSDLEKNLGWQDIKDRFNTILESITPKSNPLYRADDLMEEVAKGGLIEKEQNKIKLHQDILAKHVVKKENPQAQAQVQVQVQNQVEMN